MFLKLEGYITNPLICEEDKENRLNPIVNPTEEPIKLRNVYICEPETRRRKLDRTNETTLQICTHPTLRLIVVIFPDFLNFPILHQRLLKMRLQQSVSLIIIL